jgi:membrane-associated phospholipid phosphatase
MPVAAPSPSARAVLAGLVAVLAVLIVLVESGAARRLDQWSLDHLMPWLVPGNSSGGGSAGFYRPFTWHTTTPIKLLDLWTYPCSVLISALVVGVVGAMLWRPLGPIAALAPAAAWVFGNAIEVTGKGVITRSALYGTADGVRVHVVPFDDSFPSGHMMRGVIVAFAISLVWSRATRWVVAWAVLVGPALVFQSAHTITDVVGGALVGLIVVIAVYPAVVAARPARAP